MVLQDISEQSTNPLPRQSTEGVAPEDGQKDISDIEVPDYFRRLITEGSRQVEDKIIEPPKPEIPMADGLPQQTNELVGRFKELLLEAEEILSELTSVGMIGVNLGGPAKKDNLKKKIKEKNPWARCHASTGPKKTSRFERCVKRIKAKNR